MTFSTGRFLHGQVQYASDETVGLIPEPDMSSNIELARNNMIEQQVRTWEVLDSRVLDTLGSVPREDFVPSRYRKLAFSDLRIPLGDDQVMMKPVEEGRMLQALTLTGSERVLEIGTGSGFISACLATLAAEVHSIEINPRLAESAADRLSRLGYGNVRVECADALGGYSPEGSYDVLVVTGSAAEPPSVFFDWLERNGRLFIVRGHSPAMEAVCLTGVGTRWLAESLFETDLPRLIGAEDAPVFEF